MGLLLQQGHGNGDRFSAYIFFSQASFWGEDRHNSFLKRGASLEKIDQKRASLYHSLRREQSEQRVTIKTMNRKRRVIFESKTPHKHEKGKKRQAKKER